MEREHITDRAHGIDVSHHQGQFLFNNTWGQIDFAIAKIGEGYNSPYSTRGLGDPADFLRLWEYGCSEAEIRGVYFYQRSGYSWESQANFVLEAIRNLFNKPHMIWCDVEKTRNVIDKTMLADTLRIMEYWKANSSYTVGLYANKDVMQNYIQPIGLKYYGQEWLNRLHSYPLWYAQYYWQPSPNKQPSTPSFRSNWDIWQYTNGGDSIEIRNGIRMRRYGSPDLNAYNGSVEEMKTWLGIGEAPPPPVPIRPKVTITVQGDVEVEIK